jgi:purine-binding chemotaxis protein CheW
MQNEPVQSTSSTERLDVVVFHLGPQRLGVAVPRVQEVVRAVAISPLPGAPTLIRGVINVRGDIVPVLDLRVRFGLPSKDVELTDRFVVLHIGGRSVALHVDRAETILPVETADVGELDNVRIGKHYVAGVVRLPDGLLLIAEPERFLSDSEAAALNAVMEHGE